MNCKYYHPKSFGCALDAEPCNAARCEAYAPATPLGLMNCSDRELINRVLADPSDVSMVVEMAERFDAKVND